LWLRFSLFGEETMKIRVEVVEARKQAAREGSTTGAPGSAV
jgi:hypothetical protein